LLNKPLTTCVTAKQKRIIQFGQRGLKNSYYRPSKSCIYIERGNLLAPLRNSTTNNRSDDDDSASDPIPCVRFSCEDWRWANPNSHGNEAPKPSRVRSVWQNQRFGVCSFKLQQEEEEELANRKKKKN
jgi:hypothetical protein